MKPSTKQRIFWCVSALLIAAALFSLLFLITGKAGVPAAETVEAAGENELISGQQIISGMNLWTLARVFLFVLLGFSGYYFLSGKRLKIPLAAGSGILFSVVFELCREVTGHDGSWQDALANGAAAIAGVGFAALAAYLLRVLKRWFDGGCLREQKRVETILDALAIAAVMHYAVFRFLQSTLFVFHYTDRYKTITLLLLILTGGIRFLYLMLKKLWQIPDPGKQSFLLLRCILACCLAIPFFLTGLLHNCKPLIFLPFAVLCFYGMDPEKICRIFLLTIGTFFAATVLCCLSGTVRNLVFYKGIDTGSYGIINSTDFASYFSFLLLAAWCGMKNRTWQASVLFAVLTGAISCIVYMKFTDSRTILVIGILTVLFVLWECLEENVLKKKNKWRRFVKGIDWLCVLAFPLMGACVVILTAAYGQNVPLAVQVDDFLSTRLQVTLKPYLQYGIQPLGSTIEPMIGYGRTIIRRVNSGYTYLDVAYAMLAIRYGWIITAVVTGLWVWFTARAIKSGRRRFAFAMAVLTVHAFSEARILDVNYNIFLLLPFSALPSGRKETAAQTGGTEESKMRWFPVLAGAILVVCLYFALPTVLSWLRSFFALMRWNKGEAAGYSLAVWAAITLLVGLLWKAVSMLGTHRRKGAFVLLICTAALLTGGALAVNSVIERGVKEQAPRIAEEEQIIRRVQDTAVLPVYAADAEEIYQRCIGGFAKHFFSTEELRRSPRGSIFVDSSFDAITLTRMGGKYVQISEWSGLYSFDPAVIDALADAGYTWQDFYCGKTICNLKEAAHFNGLREEDAPVLRGPIRFAAQNMEIDHFAGMYAASFTLSSPVPAEDGKVALLQVITSADQQVILEHMVTAEDFDEQGRCVYSMIYKIPARPRVSFVVSVAAGACVTLEEISHQRMEKRVQLRDGVNRLISPTDNWAGWLTPSASSTENYLYATLVLPDSCPGDIYSWEMEIEFKDVVANEGTAFSFSTHGAVDGSWKTANIWNDKLVHLDTPPENGVYRFTSESMITKSNADASDFNLEFCSENWAGGAFRVKSITIEKSKLIVSQPVSETVNEGGNATFSVGADGATGYQWYYQKPGETGWNKVINNGTSAVYTLTTKARHNGYKYRCRIFTDSGDVYSDIVTLTVK